MMSENEAQTERPRKRRAAIRLTEIVREAAQRDLRKLLWLIRRQLDVAYDLLPDNPQKAKAELWKALAKIQEQGYDR